MRVVRCFDCHECGQEEWNDWGQASRGDQLITEDLWAKYVAAKNELARLESEMRNAPRVEIYDHPQQKKPGINIGDAGLLLIRYDELLLQGLRNYAMGGKKS